MLKPMLCAAALAWAVTPALAADDDVASAEETAKVAEAIARIGCKPDPQAGVEKERDDLYEVDDAQCEIGQYDIKLNADFVITSITLD
ncbi:PepSY domain-containing protein [Paracoccus sp. DMF]|uniref:PepSY domain-containing protein n=1 Tax=Paracoccus sp. DMF TaxID=400837 RepID=UPI0021E497E3|nr:PepSY domain-containing protein [Paracoccus sp. DMF]MCV2446042.1 PepSY domain-containing protein [Paracoccus sp. DMF]